MVCNSAKLFIPFSVCTVLVLFSMEMIPTDVIIKIVITPNFTELSKIIQIKQGSDYLLLDRKNPYTSNEIRNVLFPAYALLLTCKQYFTIDKNLLKNLAVNNLCQLLPPGIALYLFPKDMRFEMKDKYYPDTARTLIKAVYENDLVKNPGIIAQCMADMNGNTILPYKFFPEIGLCTLLERIMGCITNFMKNNNHNYMFFNCIAVLDYICLQKGTNLRMDGMINCKKNLAQSLFDTFNNNRYQALFSQCFSSEAQTKIHESCILKESDDSLKVPEDISLKNKLVIEHLIATYLVLLPRKENVKKVINRHHHL
jgi:hypothetical protein